MPELPEVETIVRGLRGEGASAPGLLGRRVRAVHLLWPRSLAIPTEPELQARLPGQVLQAITRRGKFLLLHFDTDTLLVHLRMSGRLIVESPLTGMLRETQSAVDSWQWPVASDQMEGADPQLPAGDHQQSTINNEQSVINIAHIRLAVDFDGGVRLVFVDPRKFGRVWLVKDPEEVVGGLGPEPLDPKLTAVEFHARLTAHRKLLKPLLLDQSFLAGLGNIYTDEALNLTRLHPCQPTQALPYSRAEELLNSIRIILNSAIERQGASFDWVYPGGNFQNYFRAYQQTGKPCQNCGQPITRTVVGQRGTHFCPNCQLIVN